MNAIQLIEQVRTHRADLVVENDRLIVRGHGNRLPDDLRAALHTHRVELMIALGRPIDVTVSAVLPELRPHLPKSLQRLSDSDLLVLVNWSIINAWNASVRKLELDAKR